MLEQKCKFLLIFVQIEDLWDSMCSSAIALTSKALTGIDNAETLLKIKGLIALFVQTMEVSIPSHDLGSGLTKTVGLGVFDCCIGQVPATAL